MLTRFCSSRCLTSVTRRQHRANSRNFSTESDATEAASMETKFVEDSTIENIEHKTTFNAEVGFSHGKPALTLKRFSKLSASGDVIRFFERHAQVSPTEVIRMFDNNKKRVVAWRVEFESKAVAEKAAAAVWRKNFGLFAQPKLVTVASSYKRDSAFRPDDLMVEISNTPTGMTRKDLVHFLRISMVTPIVLLEMKQKPGTSPRWFAKYATPEERTIALIKRSGQYMHPFGRTDVVSEKKVKLTPLAM